MRWHLPSLRGSLLFYTSEGRTMIRKSRMLGRRFKAKKSNVKCNSAFSGTAMKKITSLVNILLSLFPGRGSWATSFGLFRPRDLERLETRPAVVWPGVGGSCVAADLELSKREARAPLKQTGKQRGFCMVYRWLDTPLSHDSQVDFQRRRPGYPSWLGHCHRRHFFSAAVPAAILAYLLQRSGRLRAVWLAIERTTRLAAGWHLTASRPERDWSRWNVRGPHSSPVVCHA